MKCVTKDNELRRVTNEHAEELVKKGWEYTSKKLWKMQPNTTWTKASTPPNPMSQSKVRRKELRNQAFLNSKRNG